MLSLAINNETVKAGGPIPFLTNNLIYEGDKIMVESKVTKFVRICKVEGCSRKHEAKGYCSRHYKRVRKNGHIYLKPINALLACQVHGCTQNSYSKDLCVRHYNQMRKHGHIYGNAVFGRRTANEYEIKDSVCEISLRDNVGHFLTVALIDTDDVFIANSHKWCLSNGYAKSTINGKVVALHHVIIGVIPSGMEVDHRNTNTLDNRRSNLRFATKSQNAANRPKPISNTSGYKGVSWDKRCKKWYTAIQYEGNGYFLGRFDDKLNAAMAYNEKAKELFGEFAYLNEVEL
jgi:hypothetical protein